MRTIRARVGTALLLTLVTAAGARAGSISITTSPRAELANGRLAVTVRVSNSGDEAAQSVTPLLRFGETVVRGKGQPTLRPNDAFEETLTVDAGDLAEGRWPYAVAVDYTDANQYPFQGLQVTTIAVGSAPPAKVAVPEVKADPIAGTGTVRVRVKNLAAAARTLDVRFHLPEGLETDQGRRTLEVGEWGEQTVAFDVVNRTALAGSRYPVFVTLEYDDAGTHHAFVAQGIAEIVPGETALDRNARYLWIGVATLVGLWILLVIVRAVRGRR